MAEKATGQPMKWRYVEENRVGDHICYYSDLRKMKAHYPAWSITKPARPSSMRSPRVGRSDPDRRLVDEDSDHRDLRFRRQHPGRAPAANGSQACPFVGIDNLMRPGSGDSTAARLRNLGVKCIHGDIRAASDFETLPTAEWVIDAAANPSVLAGLGRAVRAAASCSNTTSAAWSTCSNTAKMHRAGLRAAQHQPRLLDLRRLASLPLMADGQRLSCSTIPAPLPPGVSARGIGLDFSTAPPISLYGSTKLASETVALEYGEAFELSGLGQPLRCAGRCGTVRHARSGYLFLLDQRPPAAAPAALHRLRRHRAPGAGRFHPYDLAALAERQMRSEPPRRSADLHRRRRLGERPFAGAVDGVVRQPLRAPHAGEPARMQRAYDVPWVVMDIERWRARIRLAARRPGIEPCSERLPPTLPNIPTGSSGAACETPSGTAGGEPLIALLSIVIPARDEEGCIAATVEHLYVELRLQGVEHEIVVVDDGSTDATWASSLEARRPRTHPASGPEHRRARLRPRHRPGHSTTAGAMPWSS